MPRKPKREKVMVYLTRGQDDLTEIDRARAITHESRSAFMARAALETARGQKSGLPGKTRRRLQAAFRDMLAEFE